MKRSITLTLLLPLMLSGCASVFSTPVPGTPAEEVIALKGSPDAEYLDGNIRLLEWSVGPWAQYAYMARIGPDGRLISYEQVLTREKFDTIRIDHFSKDDVLKTVGHPTETDYLPLVDREVWAYRYKEDGIWNSMMYIYFDSQGIVRRMENGQDPMYLRK
ncbi:outer membrane protein assembly factor BamE [Oxalobacter aliiformigenes]|uniref:outer membrane protein assembly factor BamE n=1 Tax=Oxalobacter aliiformigenes TaxID=2946593 RepID=UPI0022AEF1CB|nr:outer membrane protein assembly factor BamE [Oxalobacter aliiformigenes]MCZ4065056.1 outer membrane protein assembly factor BamE [Oxalobacter aliiformigenes]WAV99320.1 outer membrane protein assembly factor BamE [Oxalobacter aliiformigenes]